MFVVEQDTYLEHFGIKGMRWGIRNKSLPERTPAQKAIRNKRIVIGAVAGVGAAAAVLSLIKLHGSMPYRSIPKQPMANIDFRKAFSPANFPRVDPRVSSDFQERLAASMKKRRASNLAELRNKARLASEIRDLSSKNGDVVSWILKGGTPK